MRGPLPIWTAANTTLSAHIGLSIFSGTPDTTTYCNPQYRGSQKTASICGFPHVPNPQVPSPLQPGNWRTASSSDDFLATSRQVGLSRNGSPEWPWGPTGMKRRLWASSFGIICGLFGEVPMLSISFCTCLCTWRP